MLLVSLLAEAMYLSQLDQPLALQLVVAVKSPALLIVHCHPCLSLHMQVLEETVLLPDSCNLMLDCIGRLAQVEVEGVQFPYSALREFLFILLEHFAP